MRRVWSTTKMYVSTELQCESWICIFGVKHKNTFHALFLIAWLADRDSLMCCIVRMGSQIAKMFSTFSLWGSLFPMSFFWGICLWIWETAKNMFPFSLGYIRTVFQFYVLKMITSWTRFGNGQISIETETHSLQPLHFCRDAPRCFANTVQFHGLGKTSHLGYFLIRVHPAFLAFYV